MFSKYLAAFNPLLLLSQLSVAASLPLDTRADISSNFVVNGNFETGLLHPWVFRNFSRAAKHPTVTASIVSAGYHSTYALLLVDKPPGNNGFVFLEQDLSIAQNATKFVFRASYLRQRNSTGDCTFEFSAADGDWIVGFHGQEADNFGGVPGKWHTIDRPFNISDDSNTISISLFCLQAPTGSPKNAASVLVDNISITPQ